jgi:hypothetical protein
MKKRIFGRVLVVFFILTASAYFIKLQGQEVRVFFPNESGTDLGNPDGIGGRISGVQDPKITLEFKVGVAGQVALEASTISTHQPNIDLINTWNNDNVGNTSLQSIWGKSFSLILTANKRMQCRNGGGLGMQGINQWRIDDAGAEELYLILEGEVGIDFVSVEYFDINYQGGKANFRIKDYDTDEVWYFDNIGGSIGVLNFEADQYNMRYKSDRLTITNSDTTGLANAGGRFYGFSFNVVEALPKPPAVLSTDPVHADTTVETTTDYVILFDGPMNQTATSAAITIEPNVQNRTDTWNEDSDQLTITFDELPYITEYLVTVSSNVLGTNGLNAVSDYIFTFRTLPEPPTVIYTFPENLTKNVPLTTPFEIEFSKSMIPDSVEQAISFNPAATGLEFIWNADNSTVFFSTDALLSNTLYFGTVSTVATDIYGIRFPEPFQFAFTTGKAVTVKNNNLSEVVIYPNPADDIIHVRGVDVKSVMIHEITGKLVKVMEGTSVINLSDIQPGSYMITVMDRENNKFRELIIIE